MKLPHANTTKNYFEAIDSQGKLPYEQKFSREITHAILSSCIFHGFLFSRFWSVNIFCDILFARTREFWISKNNNNSYHIFSSIIISPW